MLRKQDDRLRLCTARQEPGLCSPAVTIAVSTMLSPLLLARAGPPRTSITRRVSRSSSRSITIPASPASPAARSSDGYRATRIVVRSRPPTSLSSARCRSGRNSEADLQQRQGASRQQSYVTAPGLPLQPDRSYRWKCAPGIAAIARVDSRNRRTSTSVSSTRTGRPAGSVVPARRKTRAKTSRSSGRASRSGGAGSCEPGVHVGGSAVRPSSQRHARPRTVPRSRIPTSSTTRRPTSRSCCAPAE